MQTVKPVEQLLSGDPVPYAENAEKYDIDAYGHDGKGIAPVLAAWCKRLWRKPFC